MSNSTSGSGRLIRIVSIIFVSNSFLNLFSRHKETNVLRMYSTYIRRYRILIESIRIHIYVTIGIPQSFYVREENTWNSKVRTYVVNMSDMLYILLNSAVNKERNSNKFADKPPTRLLPPGRIVNFRPSQIHQLQTYLLCLPTTVLVQTYLSSHFSF